MDTTTQTDATQTRIIAKGVPRPVISNITETDEMYEFDCDNINVSIMNSLRRVILSEIDTVVIRTEPYEKCDVVIHKNVSRINNEMLKQRLACIPIHIKDDSIQIEDYVIEVNVVNEENSTRLVTTEDFKIKNIKTGTYLRDVETRSIFPPNSFTGDYIVLTRLQPKIVTGQNAECIHFEAKMTRSNAKEHGAYNVVSCCSYMMMPDVLKQRESWKLYEQSKKDKGEEITDEMKKDWELLDAQRIYKKNAFHFNVESIGVYTNVEIIKKACDIMIEKISKLETMIKADELDIVKGKNSMDCMDIILENEDHTLGKVIEYALYKLYFEDDAILRYVGFNKFHPHDDYSVIRISKSNIGTEDETNTITKEEVHNLFENVCRIMKDVYEQIKSQI